MSTLIFAPCPAKLLRRAEKFPLFSSWEPSVSRVGAAEPDINV